MSRQQKYVRTLLPPFMVQQTLAGLRIEVEYEAGDEYWALCPAHLKRTGREDRKPSWSINGETGLHSCFSCGFRGNLYVLIREMSGKDTADQFRRGMDSGHVPVFDGYRVDRPSAPLPKRRRSAVRKHLKESELALFSHPPQWAIEARHLDRASVDFYGIKWDKERNSWIIPLRDPHTEQLIGYQLKGQGERVFLNRPTGMDKGSTLFGVLECRQEPVVVVVESPLDAVRLHRLGYAAMAVCGSRVTEKQLDILRRHDDVVFAMDNDPAGALESERLRRIMPGFRYRVIKYPDGSGKDVGEMVDDAIVELIF
jgi:DNA primase